MCAHWKLKMDNVKARETFSEWINGRMKAKAMSQAELVGLTSLSSSQISRICRDTNDRDRYYTPKSVYEVMELSIALSEPTDKMEEILYIAFPELECWQFFIENQMELKQVNEYLFDLGLKEFGNFGND